MGIVLLTSITLTTIVYSAFNTELQIKGEAMLRVKEEVRITKLTLTEFSSGAIETYNNKFGKYTTNLYVTLPSNASMTYEVEITNSSSKDYDVSKIIESLMDNSNLNVIVTLKIGDIINKHSSKKFTIEITNNTLTDQVGTIVYHYSFIEHINSYVLGNYDTPKMYEVTIPYAGEYKIELWGAQGGGDSTYVGGLGGYTAGNIRLEQGTSLYVYVGETPSKAIVSSYNGGGDAGSNFNLEYYYGGGGATDIRLTKGDWDNFNSLKSRLMVAAGGAGSGTWGGRPVLGGAAGGLLGYDGALTSANNASYLTAEGGKQTKYGISHYNGGFSVSNASLLSGKFGSSCIAERTHGTGGGSGYYGGACGMVIAYDNVDSGGGGSSFISGHNGCDAIKEMSTYTNIIHTGQSVHYSGYNFTDTVMIDGKGCTWTTVKGSCSTTGQPQPDGSEKEGHSGNGYARITFIERVFD